MTRPLGPVSLVTAPNLGSYSFASDWLSALVLVVGNWPATGLAVVAAKLVELVREANTGSPVGAAASLPEPLQFLVVAPVLLP